MKFWVILVMMQLVISWKWFEKMLVEVLGDISDVVISVIVEGDGEHVG